MKESQEKKTFKERKIEELGSEESFKEYMRSLASKGGSKVTEKTKNKGFGSNPELARVVGERGRMINMKKKEK